MLTFVSRRSARGIQFGLAAFLVIVSGAGCAVAPIARSIIETAQKARGSRPLRSATVDESYARDLLQNASQTTGQSAGLVVAEPVSKNAPREIADFATGCARWLHLHASGHGELGRTPLWGAVADARDLLPRSDLRLTKADAARFASLLGVTHVALGTISGTSARATLSYQLFRTTPKLQALGSPLVAVGTREQIVQKLPQMASSLATSLGIRSGLATPKIAPADFAVLGQAPWKARQPVAPALASRLAALSAREPLAGVLFLRSGNPRAKKAELVSTLASLMKNASGNTIAVADAARFYMADIAPQRNVVTALRTRFPASYLPATSEMQMHLEAGDWAQAQNAAEDAVRAAPQNAGAWLDLQTLLGNYAQSIRNGKYYARMSMKERRAVSTLYPQQLAAALRASQLTPQDSIVWSEVAEAATFNGNTLLADQALWKAQALDKSNPFVYSWGLQMYQPKWGGDRKKLLQIARLAVQHADPNRFPGSDLVEAIFHGGLLQYREELLVAAVKRSPNNAIVNYEYGAIYHYDKRDYKTAEKHYRIALKNAPQYARALGSMGDLYFFVKNDRAGAGRLYRQAVSNAPNDTALRDKLNRFTASTAPATTST